VTSADNKKTQKNPTMPYEIALQLEQERIEQQDDIAGELYLEGMTDGAFGYPPRYAVDAYLSGYCQGIKQMPQDSEGRVIYCASLAVNIADEF
jgi:hypothetical protein